ncbi:unnamed protein product [Amoebophrya sp. A25]|nr:unnamed protein product [Amoebophrya sp. A25]|eukprot:GSA25T00008852001.1
MKTPAIREHFVCHPRVCVDVLQPPGKPRLCRVFLRGRPRKESHEKKMRRRDSPVKPKGLRAPVDTCDFVFALLRRAAEERSTLPSEKEVSQNSFCSNSMRPLAGVYVIPKSYLRTLGTSGELPWDFYLFPSGTAGEIGTAEEIPVKNRRTSLSTSNFDLKKSRIAYETENFFLDLSSAGSKKAAATKLGSILQNFRQEKKVQELESGQNERPSRFEKMEKADLMFAQAGAPA